MMNALKSGRSLPTIKSLIDCSSCRKQLSRPVTKAALTTNHDVTTNRHDDSTFGSTQSSNPRPLYLDVQATTPMVCPLTFFCISHDFRIRVWWMQCYHTRYKAMCDARLFFIVTSFLVGWFWQPSQSLSCLWLGVGKSGWRCQGAGCKYNWCWHPRDHIHIWSDRIE